MRRTTLPKAIQPALRTALNGDAVELSASVTSTQHIASDAHQCQHSSISPTSVTAGNIPLSAKAITCTSLAAACSFSFRPAAAPSVSVPGSSSTYCRLCRRKAHNSSFFRCAAFSQAATITSAGGATADAGQLPRGGEDGEDGNGTSASPPTSATTAAASGSSSALQSSSTTTTTTRTASVGRKAPTKSTTRKRKANSTAAAQSAEKNHSDPSHFVGNLNKVLKPINQPSSVVAQKKFKAKLRAHALRQANRGDGEAADVVADAVLRPWSGNATDGGSAAAGIEDGGIAFSDSATELFELDEAKHDEAPALTEGEEDVDGASVGESRSALTVKGGAQGGDGGGPADFFTPSTSAAAVDIDEPLLDDPFHIPSVDDDAFVRDREASPSSSNSLATAGGHYRHNSGDVALAHSGAAAAASLSSSHNEAVLSSVDLLCDDLFHCKTEVLRSFARSRGVRMRSKAEVVLQLVEEAHRAAHGQSDDLAVTRKLLGDVFDESVRTSGVRTAWTNKSLEASHIEMACERHLHFELMANRVKTLMVRHNFIEASRVLRKLTRLFQEEQEQLSVVAVGGVFRNYRAEADELVRSLPTTELVSPFASFLVSYIRYADSAAALSRENVNERLVQMGLFQPTLQEMDDTTTLHRLMEMLDPAVREVELAQSIVGRDGGYTGFAVKSPQLYVAVTRAFSEASHTRWDTSAAPDWVHDLARLFCNWETIVRTDLPRFEDVPRYFFDCILGGVVQVYVMRRIYGEASGAEPGTAVRRSLRLALLEHMSNEENVQSALNDLGSYVHTTRHNRPDAIRSDFFAMVLSQMQGAFQDFQEERTALHDERVAVVLRSVGDAASQCTRSHNLFSLLSRITEDMHFHLRFQRVYKKLSGADRKTVRMRPSTRLDKTLAYFETEYQIAPLSVKAVGFLVVQMLYLALRGDGSKRPVLERVASVAGAASLDLVGLTETKAVNVRDLHIAFPPQLSYNSWLNESDTREKSVYNVLPSVAVKGATNQAMIVSQAPMMKALDAISRVPWRINKYMLHVQEAIVREGFGFGKIRPGFYPLHYYGLSDGSVHYPSDRRRRTTGSLGDDDDDDDADGAAPTSHGVSGRGGSSGVHAHNSTTGNKRGEDAVFNLQQRRHMQLQQNADWKELTELRSSRIHYLQALRQARSILQFSHIYFPNSMDFRGRMYPLPGRLNHTGSDPFRGLLEYAEPKPLGSVGLYWLKVHLANKMGMSKLSFDERVHYVDEHMEDVVESAESPLQGDRWWQEASEPLQCLMACKEVASAMKCSQGPEKFLSRLPVAVDGSYNGLQHYSAIGRDAFGAALVNLIPSERPADAYTGILKEMLKSIHADAARDHQVAQRCLGSGKGQDKDHIKRKTIKRPIMTQVYGVTGYGMSEQIFDELQKQNKSHGLWTHTDMKEMAAYLRNKVLESLGVTFGETQKCRQWISEVVELIWKVQPPELRNALCWTTPLGLVVRQPYRVRNECSLFTTVGYTRIAGDAIAPASRKQLTAIAPNLIHSLDATHLAMTALEMQHQGLSMMAVHDSYWTYACDLPKLSQVLREQFVNLYSKYDPLWELKEQWEETYFMDLRRHGVKLPEPPKRGDLDLNLVLKSPYFFS